MARRLPSRVERWPVRHDRGRRDVGPGVAPVEGVLEADGVERQHTVALTAEIEHALLYGFTCSESYADVQLEPRDIREPMSQWKSAA